MVVSGKINKTQFKRHFRKIIGFIETFQLLKELKHELQNSGTLKFKKWKLNQVKS